jgi:hypothetical protein
MTGMFKNVFGGRGGQRDGRWQILIGKTIRITVPPGLPVETKWETWGALQVQLLGLLRKHWPDNHMYIRFNAFPPGYFEDKLKLCQPVKINAGREEVFLLADCEIASVLQTVLSVLGMVPFTRCIYILDSQPSNWQEVTERLFQATKKIARNQPAPEYEGELALCKCLCYSADQDLMIGKIDLPESDLMATLEQLAKDQKLSLMVRRR